MRYAEQAEGPLRVTFKNGNAMDLKDIDGGGMSFEDGLYEVHGHNLEGKFEVLLQEQIERVEVIETGEEVEFGNPFVHGHLRYQA